MYRSAKAFESEESNSDKLLWLVTMIIQSFSGARIGGRGLSDKTVEPSDHRV